MFEKVKYLQTNMYESVNLVFFHLCLNEFFVKFFFSRIVFKNIKLNYNDNIDKFLFLYLSSFCGAGRN